MDFIGMGQNGPIGSGSVAARLLANGMNVSSLRTNDTLTHEEWLLIDKTVVQVGRQRLSGVADLISAGLSVPITNAMGTTVVQHQTGSDMDAAEVNMDAVTRANKDRQEFSTVSVPLPVTHKEFSFNIRHLEASRRDGVGLDVSQAGLAARLVAEQQENTLFNGAGITFGGGTVYGYTNFPDRTTGTIPLDWAAVGTTGVQVLADVQKMVADASVDSHYGPFNLYVPGDVSGKLGEDYSTAKGNNTVGERILQIPSIQKVSISDKLASTNAVLVQMTPDSVDLLDGIQMTTVQWDTDGGMQVHFKVLSIMAPRIKSDHGGKSGVVHYSV